MTLPSKYPSIHTKPCNSAPAKSSQTCNRKQLTDYLYHQVLWNLIYPSVNGLKGIVFLLMTPLLEHRKIRLDIIYMYAWASAFTTPGLKALSVGSAPCLREEERVFSDACFWWFISLNLSIRYKDDECYFLSHPFPPQNLPVFCKIALHLRASRGCIILDDVRSWKSVLVCNLSQWVETTFSSNQFSLCT